MKAQLQAAAGELQPRPRYRAQRIQRRAAVAVEPLPLRGRPCLDGGQMWVIAGDAPRLASPTEIDTRLDRIGLAECDQRPLAGTAWEDVPSDRRAKLLESGQVGDPVEQGAASSDGRLTLAGAISLASATAPNLPAALGFDLLWHRFPRAESLARAAEPAWSSQAAPPLLSAVDALSTELALRLVPSPIGQDVMVSLLKEILFNALGHRSYRDDLLQTPVQVVCWPDAVEVRSPGGLAGPVQIADEWLDGRWGRNPRLMALLEQLGRVRQQGEGAGRIRTLARHLGWRVQAQEEPDAVVITLERAPALSAERTRENRQRLPRGEVATRITTLLAGADSLAAKEISEQLGVPASTVRATLQELLREGEVEQTQIHPSAPNQRYRLTGSKP